MLEINVALEESYDEENKQFVTSSFRVELEHSLVSVSKWESFWEKAFLGKDEKTTDETISYVKMMILGDEPPPEIFQSLLDDHLPQIKAYIEAKMTATTVPDVPGGPGRQELITAELIYYWMISMNIPVEFQHWHLNRLIMLIRVINVKNAPKKKMSMSDRRTLNRQRLAQMNSRG